MFEDNKSHKKCNNDGSESSDSDLEYDDEIEVLTDEQACILLENDISKIHEMQKVLMTCLTSNQIAELRAGNLDAIVEEIDDENDVQES